jgi:hypothetical protein
MTAETTAVPLVVGKAGVPIDCYDAIELLAVRRDDYAARLLADAARGVADWWNDPPVYWSREAVREAAPDLAELLDELLGGGPGDITDVRPAGAS